MTTNVDIVKRALAQVGTKSQITSLADGSAEATYASLLYTPLRDFMLRQYDYDFSIATVTPTVLATPGLPWAFQYAWPAAALRIRAAIPSVLPSGQLDPYPVEFNAVYSIGVFSKIAIGALVITNSAVTEDDWDPEFTESYTRFLGSVLAFALENRIEASREKLQEALQFAGIANLRDG